jgi:hypothetical protein
VPMVDLTLGEIIGIADAIDRFGYFAASPV